MRKLPHLENHVPVRLVDERTGKPLKRPVYCESSVIAPKEFQELRLGKDQSCIYLVSAYDSDMNLLAQGVGETSQFVPLQRPRCYASRVKDQYPDNATTVTKFQELGLSTKDKFLAFYAEVIEICHTDERRAAEKRAIETLRAAGANLLNAT
jgi:hypothetical protein